METFETEWKVLCDWARAATKKADDAFHKKYFAGELQGRDSEESWELQRINQEFNKRARALKQKYGK